MQRPDIEFTCPICGGHNWGTVASVPGLSGPVGMCHNFKNERGAVVPCDFVWQRADDYLVMRSRGVQPVGPTVGTAPRRG